MNMYRAFVRVTPSAPVGFPESERNPPMLFVYEASLEARDQGRYVVYSISPEAQRTWADWLERIYFPPHIFVTRFGYAAVDAGRLRDSEHLRELLIKIGFDSVTAQDIVSIEASR